MAAWLRMGRGTSVNLALQGGGAHGALTWGALDGLLAHSDLAIDGISGASAGAVNAVALASGYLEGGREGAREKLEAVWRAISQFGAPGSYPLPLRVDPATVSVSTAVMERGFKQLRRIWSPFDLNPLDISPLREILAGNIDFEELQRASPFKLFISATEVTSGRSVIFREREITVETILASTCLPVFSPPVRIGRFHYWDGGFSANPDLLELIPATRARDTIVVQISPDRDPTLPASSEHIAASISRLTFNQPLRAQIELIESCRQAPRLPLLTRRRVRRLGGHRFHLIDGSRYTLGLSEDTKAKPDWPLVSRLHAEGLELATAWLTTERRHVGRRSSADLYGRYIADRLPFN